MTTLNLENLVPAYKTESCFTSEGLQWALDSTSIKIAKECWYKYYLSIMLGLRASVDAPPLTFGTLLHVGYEVYYRSRFEGKDHRPALHDMLRAVLSRSSFDEGTGEYKIWWSSDRKRNTITLLRTLVNRLDELQDDAKFTLSIDGKAAIELPFRFELPRLAAAGQPYTLVGIMDRLVQHGSRIWPEDYKHTTSAFKSDNAASVITDRFSMDLQMTVYTIAGQVIYHQPVSGVLINFHNIQINDSSCARGPVERPEEYIEEWLNEFNRFLDELEINIATNTWPHRETSCFLCHFKGICSKAPSMRHRYLATGYHQHKWNPLTVREA